MLHFPRMLLVAISVAVALSPLVVPELAAERRAARPGTVRLEGQVFADDAGPHLAVGTTLFWGVWGYLHDRPKLEANLEWLADQGTVDYIRVLGVVGPDGGWHDRAVTGREPGYDAAIAGLTDLAYDRYGLRIEWTIFGGLDSHPSQKDRVALVERFIAMTAGRAHKIEHFELVNEGQGVGGPELRELGRLVKERTPNLVALTSAYHHPDGLGLYQASAAHLMTLHHRRDIEGRGGRWRPVVEAREGRKTGWPWTSNEPIGPQSSVEADDDPLRLTMAAATTWLCAGAAYVYHASAGIRGGGQADRGRERAADLWDVPNAAATLAGIGSVRALLPNDLPNWTWHDGTVDSLAHLFNVESIPGAGEDAVLNVFAVTQRTDFVVMAVAVRAKVPLVARQAMTFTVYDPLNGAALEKVTLGAGETYLLAPERATDAFVIRGALQGAAGHR